MAKPFIEAGKEISAKNQSRLRSILKQIQDFFSETGLSLEDDPTESSDSVQKEAGGFAQNDQAKLLQDAINATRPKDATNPDRYVPPRSIADIYDDRLIYRDGWDGPFYSCDYTISTDGIVALGTPSLVVRKVDYIEPGSSSDLANSESAIDYTVETDYIPLVESAISDKGETRIKLIAPGWGSSGYYPADVLQRDGPNVFKSGTHMYIDHPTAKEEAERPEGTVSRLAGTLIEDARYINDPKHGPGLYARAHVKQGFRQDLNDLHNAIGTSIRAGGKARLGEAEGRKGPIITQIDKAKSVDYVTRAGAGGRVLALFESARNRANDQLQSTELDITESTVDTTIGETNMTPEEIAAIVKASVDEAVKPLQEALSRQQSDQIVRNVQSQIADHVKTIKGLPSTAHARVVAATMAEAQPNEQGSYDVIKLCESANKNAKAELEYLMLNGAFRRMPAGFGETRSLEESAKPNDVAVIDEMSTMFQNWGMSESGAKSAAKGRER